MMKNGQGKIEITASIEMTCFDPRANIKSSVRCSPIFGQNAKVEEVGQADEKKEMKPVLDVTLVAGRPRIDWEQQSMHAIEIHVKRNDMDPYAFLAIDTIPDYDDTAPLPEAGQSAVWKYRAIYRLGDERAGQWSEEVSIVVMG